jgi:hypothetical protein
MSTQGGNDRVERWAHIAQIFAIPIAVATVAVTFYQTQTSLKASQRELEQSREANITYQGTALCQAYREHVIELYLKGYNDGEIRSTFLGEHDDVMQPPSEVNNVYEGFYLGECGSIEGITRRLSRPPPLERR